MSPAGGSVEGRDGTIEYGPDGRITGKSYDQELFKLQEDMVDLQEWIKREGLRVAVIFEGRDAAGKGGVVKRITQRLNHRRGATGGSKRGSSSPRREASGVAAGSRGVGLSGNPSGRMTWRRSAPS
jgi:hypothetical protein